MTELRKLHRRQGDSKVSPQSRITLTNLIGISGIIIAIAGSAAALYAAVVSNKSSQDQINASIKGELVNLKDTDKTITEREERFETILLEIRDRQIRMEERQKRNK